LGAVSDDELLLMYREGDADAFDALFHRHHVSVYNFARVMLNGSEGAEDIMQEAFLAVARTAKTYKPRGRFRPWLMRICRNLCLNRLRAEHARRWILSPGELEALASPAEAESVSDRLERDEQMAVLRQAIGELPERHREAIALYAFEQMKYREIAEVLEVPLGTVKTLIHRARARLAEAMKESTDDDV
jgi:RNA polymerase sigma-70 factor (ECF subfamily)